MGAELRPELDQPAPARLDALPAQQIRIRKRPTLGRLPRFEYSHLIRTEPQSEPILRRRVSA